MNHRVCLLLFMAMLMHLCISAQEETLPPRAAKNNKPLLFAALPQSFEVNQAGLQEIFKSNINDNIHIQLSSQLSIQGKVVDKSQHTPGSLSVNIRVSNYANALFNLTLRLMADNSTSIQGRLLHPAYGDVLQLYKQDDKYFVKKNSQALVMPE